MESAHRTGSKDNDVSWNSKSGIHFHYYRDDDGEIYFDNEPEGGKPDWMERADRKLRNRAHKKK